jgi:hypothetical protein
MPTSHTRLARLLLTCFVLSVTAVAVPAAAFASGGRTQFIASAHENADGTVTYPLHRGTSRGQTVYYVITDTSNGDLSSRLGVNTAQKLANAANTQAVQKVRVNADGSVDFPATVDFSPQRNVVPNPNGTGFPPAAGTQPGAIGETAAQSGSVAYSPLIQLPDGTVENAPQIANTSGQADKVVSLDRVGLHVTYRETNGFSGGKAVKYTSFDASDPVAAALEASTYAPALNAAPALDDDSTDSSRASLAAFTNGQTGAANPNRQGLNSAILDGLDPLNVLRWNPSQGRYSPLWDVHLAQWTASAIASGQNTRQMDYGDILGLVDHGLIRGFGGGAFQANNFIVNCPIVSSN